MKYTIYIDNENFDDYLFNESLRVFREKLSIDEKKKIVDNYEDECEYYEDFIPMLNWYYILSNKPKEEDIEKLLKILGITIVVLYSYEFQTYMLGICACGYDTSAQLELAYRIVDKSSPFICNESAEVFLNKEQKELLYKLREKQKRIC